MTPPPRFVATPSDDPTPPRVRRGDAPGAGLTASRSPDGDPRLIVAAGRPGWSRVFTYNSVSWFLHEWPHFSHYERHDGAAVFVLLTPEMRPWLPGHRPWVAQVGEVYLVRHRQYGAGFTVARRWQTAAGAMRAVDREAVAGG